MANGVNIPRNPLPGQEVPCGTGWYCEYHYLYDDWWLVEASTPSGWYCQDYMDSWGGGPYGYQSAAAEAAHSVAGGDPEKCLYPWPIPSWYSAPSAPVPQPPSEPEILAKSECTYAYRNGKFYLRKAKCSNRGYCPADLEAYSLAHPEHTIEVVAELNKFSIDYCKEHKPAHKPKSLISPWLLWPLVGLLIGLAIGGLAGWFLHAGMG